MLQKKTIFKVEYSLITKSKTQLYLKLNIALSQKVKHKGMQKHKIQQVQN